MFAVNCNYLYYVCYPKIVNLVITSLKKLVLLVRQQEHLHLPLLLKILFEEFR